MSPDPSRDPYFDRPPEPKEAFDPFQAPLAPARDPYFGGSPRWVLADRMSRLGAVLIDSVILLPATLPGFLAQVLFGDDEKIRPGYEIPFAILMLLTMLLLVSLQAYQWYRTSTVGQTLGKQLLGVRIVLVESGQVPGFVHGVMLRSWVSGAIGGICCIGTIYTLVDILYIFGEDRRCLHDRIASTVVVQA